MARRSLLNATKLTLDYDEENNNIILLRGDSNHQINNIEPKNRRKKEISGRRYCSRQAYNLAISLLISMEKCEYNGIFEITSGAFEKIRAYEENNKPHFETCVEYGIKKYYSKASL